MINEGILSRNKDIVAKLQKTVITPPPKPSNVEVLSSPEALLRFSSGVWRGLKQRGGAERASLPRRPSALDLGSTDVSEARSSHQLRGKSQSSQKKPSETTAQQPIPKRHGANAESSQEGARQPTLKCAQQVARRVPGAGGREPARPGRVPPELAALAAHRRGWTCRWPVLSSGLAESPRSGAVPGPGPSILVNGAPSSPVRGCPSQCQSYELKTTGTESGFRVPSNHRAFSAKPQTLSREVSGGANDWGRHPSAGLGEPPGLAKHQSQQAHLLFDFKVYKRQSRRGNYSHFEWEARKASSGLASVTRLYATRWRQRHVDFAYLQGFGACAARSLSPASWFLSQPLVPRLLAQRRNRIYTLPPPSPQEMSRTLKGAWELNNQVEKKKKKTIKAVLCYL